MTTAKEKSITTKILLGGMKFLLLLFFYYIIIFIFSPTEEVSLIENILAFLLAIMTIVSYWFGKKYNDLKKLQCSSLEWENNILLYKTREKQLITKAEEIVVKYLNHEGSVHKNIADARKDNASREISCKGSLTLSDLKGTIENYPELKADGHIEKILVQIEESQNMILNAKLAYNEYVTNYNLEIASFPTIFIANLCKFSALNLYKENFTEEV